MIFFLFSFEKLGKLQAANKAASISYEQELETTTEKVRSSIHKKNSGCFFLDNASNFLILSKLSKQ